MSELAITTKQHVCDIEKCFSNEMVEKCLACKKDYCYRHGADTKFGNELCQECKKNPVIVQILTKYYPVWEVAKKDEEIELKRAIKEIIA